MNALLAVAVLALLTGQLIFTSAAPGIGTRTDEPAPDQSKTVEDLCKETIRSVDDILSPFHALEAHLNKITQNMERIIKSTTAVSSNPPVHFNAKSDGHLTPIEIADLCFEVRAAVNEVYFDFSAALSPYMFTHLQSIKDNMKTIKDDTLKRTEIDGYNMKRWPALLREIDTEHLVQIENSLKDTKLHFIQDRKFHNKLDLLKLGNKFWVSINKISMRMGVILGEVLRNPNLLREEKMGMVLRSTVTKLDEIRDAIEIDNVPDIEKMRLLDNAIGTISELRRTTNELIDFHIPKIIQATAKNSSDLSVRV